MADSAAGSTPWCTPLRPACTAATTPATESARRTGTQSATRTHRTSPGVAVTNASAPGTGPSCGPSTTATPVPCTWDIQTSRSSATANSRATRLRFAATAAGSSPTWSPRLKESYGETERPPRRSVTTLRGRIDGGAAGGVLIEKDLTVPSGGGPSPLEELRDVQLFLEVLVGQRTAARDRTGDGRQRRNGDAAAVDRAVGRARRP